MSEGDKGQNQRGEGKRRGQSGARRLALLLPFCLIAVFVGLAFIHISRSDGGGADEIPNALQGKTAPPIHIPLLFSADAADGAGSTDAADGAGGAADGAGADNAARGGAIQAESAESARFFDSPSLRGRVSLVNFWGSWCPPCREEHAFLMKLADNPAFQLIGINYKDKRENAERFLGAFGNPFRQIGFDANGRAAIDWGVYGPPETFILSKSGIILYRFIGPMNETAFREKIWPIIVRANAE